MDSVARLTGRWRSWWDVNVFVMRVLSPPSTPVVAISAVIFVGGFLLLITDVRSEAWLAVGIGAIGLSKDMLSLVFRWATSPDLSLKTDGGIADIGPHLKLSQDYVKAGYSIVKIPATAEYIVRSPKVDKLLRERDFVLQERQDLLKPINETLVRNPVAFENALRCQYRQSWRAFPPQRFVNEAKVCIGSDLLDDASISVFRGSYFHSFLTNELVTRVLETHGPWPQISYRGAERFPAFVENGDHLLKSIGQSRMANHIGISTVVLTSDGRLILWRQSTRAQQSRDRLAPTGSGSCDWTDWTRASNSSSLNALVSYSMEREFREESHPLQSALAAIEIQTQVLGYFRWVRRGGKPEFVGISRVQAPYSAFEPNVAEVDAPGDVPLDYPARDVQELKSSVEALLAAAERLSVPLCVALWSIQEDVAARPGWWAAYLRAEQCEVGPITIDARRQGGITCGMQRQ